MSEKPGKKTNVLSPLREPKPKTNKFGLGIKPNALKFPHDELIKPFAEEPKEPDTPPSTSLHLLPPPTNPQILSDNSSENYPISPAKDFQKVPNSVVRDALPQGLFKGTSKHTYDALLLRTRGAVAPTRTIKVRFNDLMNWTNISHNTLRNHLRHLEQVGLIKRDWQLGDNDGAIYEVFVPDELGETAPPPTTSYHPLQPTPTSRQNVEYPSYQKVVEGGGGKTDENKDTYVSAKTLYKTKEEKFDDEPAAAFRSFEEKLNQGFKELTGREATPSDEQKLAQLGELITAELLEAASRTKVVSDPVAFLLTHLRRRLGVRTIKVETAEKETGKGTSASSTKPLRREIPLSDDEIQECPDCQGRLLIYPEGQGKGAVMCRHNSLIKAKQSEEKKEQGKAIK